LLYAVDGGPRSPLEIHLWWLRFLVASPRVRNLLLCAKHLFIAAIVANVGCRELKDEQWEFFSPEILKRAWPQSQWREEAFPAWLSRASKAAGVPVW